MSEINRFNKYNSIGYKNVIYPECNEGWYPAIEKMLDKMMEDPVKVTVYQIKEKFGELRCYYEGGSEVSKQAVEEAEKALEIVCEMCGEVGIRRNTRWIRVLCDKHYEEQLARQAASW